MSQETLPHSQTSSLTNNILCCTIFSLINFVAPLPRAFLDKMPSVKLMGPAHQAHRGCACESKSIKSL